MKRLVIALALCALGTGAALPNLALAQSGARDTTVTRVDGSARLSGTTGATHARRTTHRRRRAATRKTKAAVVVTTHTRTRTRHTIRTGGASSAGSPGASGSGTVRTRGTTGVPPLDTTGSRQMNPGGTPPTTPPGVSTGAGGISTTGASGVMTVLDLNSASREELMAVPGMTAPLADRIVTGRPYSRTSDLVSKGILTQAQFTTMQSQFSVGPSPR